MTTQNTPITPVLHPNACQLPASCDLLKCLLKHNYLPPPPPPLPISHLLLHSFIVTMETQQSPTDFNITCGYCGDVLKTISLIAIKHDNGRDRSESGKGVRTRHMTWWWYRSHLMLISFMLSSCSFNSCHILLWLCCLGLWSVCCCSQFLPDSCFSSSW